MGCKINKIRDDTITRVIDYQGLLRRFSPQLRDETVGRGATVGMIAKTLIDPMEIWGWLGKNLFYIASYETPEGVRSVVIEIWGDVEKIHIIDGNADTFRKGMLLYHS